MAEDMTFDAVELASGVNLQAELNKAKEELEALREEYRKAIEGQEHLTTRKIVQFLISRGYQVKEKMSHITVTIDDEFYELYTDELPMVNMIKRFRIDKEDEVVNWDIVPQAGRAAEDKVIMSEFRYGEKQFYEFYINSVEQVAGNFEKALPIYLDILDATEHEFIEAYNELHDRMRLEKETPENELERITKSIVTEQIEKAGRNMNQNKVLS